MIFLLSLVCVSLVIICASIFFSVQTVQYIGRVWILFTLKALKVICGIGWNIKGVENIPDTPFIMVSNQQSPWESFFLQTLFLPTSSIMKREILIIPFFGWAISRLKPISINMIKEIANKNLIMPPKSTYIEPKLRSALTIYEF